MHAWTISQILTLPIAFLLTLALVPPIKGIAQRLKFVSKIDFRRRELAPRPLLGGLAIFVGVLAANGALNHLPLELVIPGLWLVLLGAVDDKFQINARLKMICEIGAVAVWLLLTPIHSLLLVKMGLPIPVAIACHAFWVVGLINAFNMIDGMDGLASGMAMIGFLFLGFFLPAELQIFAWSLSAGCSAHLLFNRPPASIFLGDSGSLLMGFLMSAIGSTLDLHAYHSTSVLIPLFILAHPEIDAILAMVRRKKAGTPLFQGDKDHIHHKLRRIGLGAYGALGVTYFASVYCGLTALLLNSVDGGIAIGLTVFLCIVGVSSILAGVYYCEYKLAAQFSLLGTPMLHRHIKISQTPAWPKGRYNAVVFDLLPYYKELQQRGISDLNTFIVEFASWINTTFRDSQIVPAGSYSIIVVSAGSDDTFGTRERVLQSFKAIVSTHGLLKNDVGIPWGLQFYTDSTDAQAFERKFGLFLKSPVVESTRAA
jgi:UDP-GlcNAc:undecaprenyl-phosphate GlcNAc-1-phosphate transferase